MYFGHIRTSQFAICVIYVCKFGAKFLGNTLQMLLVIGRYRVGEACIVLGSNRFVET